jgi:hypothetical protein
MTAPRSKGHRFLGGLYTLLVLLVGLPVFHALNSSLLPEYFPRITQHNGSYLAYIIWWSVISVEAVVLGLVVFLLARHRTTENGLRWHQYSLRGLLLLMLLASIGMIPVAIGMQRANKQREAAEAIQKLGGSVTYDGLMVTGEPPGPAWLHALLGKDVLVTLTFVKLDKTTVTDADLEHLKGLSHLRWLSLEDTNITDAGLACLKGLTKLQTLVLSHTKVTDAGLANLKELPDLATLILMNTQITDAGLAHLKGLSQLNTLTLQDTKLTDAGLASLEDCPQLQTLILNDTEVTDAGLVHLKGLTTLRQ